MTEAAAKEPLYSEILRDIYSQTLANLKSPGRLKVFLSGGRGMGKTFLLQELAEFRDRETGVVSRIIDGRNWPAALEEIDSHHENLAKWQADKAGSNKEGRDKPGDLLVDNLDRLIASVGDQDPGLFVKLMTNLSDLFSRLPENGRLCALTSLFHSNRMVELLEFLESQQESDRKVSFAIKAFSRLIQMYDNMPINPWSRDWEKKLFVLVRVHLPRLSNEEQELCRALLARFTGGHPALLVAALSQLVALTEARDLSTITPLEDKLKIVIEDAVYERGMGVLRRALNSLRESEREEWKSAYEDLRQLALGNISAPPSRSREILLGEGLLYKDELNLKYVIPGEILRGELLREPPGPLRMEIEPDAQTPDKHGYLKVWDRLRERRIPLSGGAWSVLKTIFDEPARIISLDELCERTHLTTPNAVRSAIQRLIGDARASGVENILDNLYGKGYRKGESPNWSQLT